MVCAVFCNVLIRAATTHPTRIKGVDLVLKYALFDKPYRRDDAVTGGVTPPPPLLLSLLLHDVNKNSVRIKAEKKFFIFMFKFLNIKNTKFYD